MKLLTGVLGVAAVGLSLSAGATNVTPYYLFDGDSLSGWQITNGAVTNAFPTYFLGYPVAVRNSIWLGHRDDAGAVEYTLGGTPTGNSGTGGNNFSQLLDGATGRNGTNYGIECCGANSVTAANADWGNQVVLFDLPQGMEGSGIAFDPLDDSLYLSAFDGTIYHYGLDGSFLGSFGVGQFLIGLAYEQATDTFWGFNRSTFNLVQFDRTGAVLQDVDIPGFFPGNPWAGEMAFLDVPEPGTLALLGLGFAGLGLSRRRRPT